MNELRAKLLDQVERDGMIVVVQGRRNSQSRDWDEIDYVAPSEVESENVVYGWRKYRVIARKPTDDELAIDEQFAEAAAEYADEF